MRAPNAWVLGSGGKFLRLDAGEPRADVPLPMQIDAYTRIVLTVIAGCLLYMVGKDLSIVPAAHAQEGAPVTAVNIVEIGGAPVPAPANSRNEVSLPVRVLD
ncbi:MAG: hypothetical protein RIQ71_2284 [Verrucomicrobiota bacterium]